MSNPRLLPPLDNHKHKRVSLANVAFAAVAHKNLIRLDVQVLVQHLEARPPRT